MQRNKTKTQRNVAKIQRTKMLLQRIGMRMQTKKKEHKSIISSVPRRDVALQRLPIR